MVFGIEMICISCFNNVNRLAVPLDTALINNDEKIRNVETRTPLNTIQF